LDEQILSLLRTKLPRVSGEIERLMRSSIRLKTRPVDETTLPLGASRIGGAPDLPPEIEWPEWKGKPLSFIAQIHLADIAALDREQLLPHTGVLYFFYDVEQSTSGFDPKDKGSFRVLSYSGDLSRLVRTPRPGPLPWSAVYKPCALEFSADLTLPPVGSTEMDSLNLTNNPPRFRMIPIPGTDTYRFEDALAARGPAPPNKEFEDYVDLLDKVAQLKGATIHRMLGYPDEIQGDMRWECQLVSHGIYVGDPTGFQSPEAAQLQAGAEDWLLLLQVDSDENASMMWGDSGRIYYWIRKQDLAQRDFSKVWMILQCY